MTNKEIKVSEVLALLEETAPIALQESYDNAGLITGDPGAAVTGVLLTLDATEAVIDEAIQKGCNLVVAHHPIVFGGLKKLTGRNYVERTVIKAIRNHVAIYAIHTNLDNVQQGVNSMIAAKLGLHNTRVLEPKPGMLKKLVTFVPATHLEAVQAAVFAAGAGNIGNYDECSFYTPGTGTFRGNGQSQPFVGEPGSRHHEAEHRLEMIIPAPSSQRVVAALLEAHPYEEVAYDLLPLDNLHPGIGAGMIGELEKPLEPQAFLAHLKHSMELDCIRYTDLHKPVSKVAVCGGAGSFLLKKAMAAGADAFVTADFKYHEFFDAEQRLMIADIGHYESEKFTKALLKDLIMEKSYTFAVLLSEINTNPIKYF